MRNNQPRGKDVFWLVPTFSSAENYFHLTTTAEGITFKLVQLHIFSEHDPQYPRGQRPRKEYEPLPGHLKVRTDEGISEHCLH